jgi:hypothetical protein
VAEKLRGAFELSFGSAGQKAREPVRMGLAVSKMAAVLLGATLEVDSTVGAGTRCRLEIPNYKAL